MSLIYWIVDEVVDPETGNPKIDSWFAGDWSVTAVGESESIIKRLVKTA